MKFLLPPSALFVLTLFLVTSSLSFAAGGSERQSYLGMDRNDYPGDANMVTLRNTFIFTGYWLNNPPGAHSNTWLGKRRKLQTMGYGFLLLFNGREYKELTASGNAKVLGTRDASLAIKTAVGEGFPKNAIIFLDQEQGGRMLPEQRAYIHAWIDGVTKGGYRAGIYCSGIAFRESNKISVVTADDIRDNAAGREIHFFIGNDQCGPASGCIFPKVAPDPKQSDVAFAEAWQYAQSPRRAELTVSCQKTYAPDGNCYPPGVAPSTGLHVDIDTADSADPSQARRSESAKQSAQ